MSKYTTEVRYICETAAGLTESKGFDNIEEILEASAPRIFNFDFPLFDENYRLPLEIKILRHYYTREIGEETVGLWKLRLNSRLNEIMPYYNQLYESELLKFNPLYDVDYTRTGNREGLNTGNENKETTNDVSNRMTGTITDEGTTRLTDAMTGTVTDEGTTALTDEMTGTVTDEGTTALTDRMTGTVTDNGTTNQTTTMTGTVTDESTGDGTRTDNLTQNETNGGSDTEQGSNAAKNNHWDYYSDTPQGTVSNLENLTYLTNARHIVDDGTGSTTNKTTSYGKTVATTNTGTQRNVTENENVREYDTENELSGTDTNTKTYNTTDTKNGTDTNEKTYDTTNTKSGTDTNEKTYNTLDTKSGTDTNTKTHNTLNTIEAEGTEAITKRMNSLEDYTEHVVGKMSTVSYAKLLKEFRETFLNIDRSIIKDLSDLFFGLWE